MGKHTAERFLRSSLRLGSHLHVFCVVYLGERNPTTGTARWHLHVDAPVCAMSSNVFNEPDTYMTAVGHH
jgi:hypothetical protein